MWKGRMNDEIKIEISKKSKTATIRRKESEEGAKENRISVKINI